VEFSLALGERAKRNRLEPFFLVRFHEVNFHLYVPIWYVSWGRRQGQASSIGILRKPLVFLLNYSLTEYWTTVFSIFWWNYGIFKIGCSVSILSTVLLFMKYSTNCVNLFSSSIYLDGKKDRCKGLENLYWRLVNVFSYLVWTHQYVVSCFGIKTHG